MLEKIMKVGKNVGRRYQEEISSELALIFDGELTAIWNLLPEEEKKIFVYSIATIPSGEHLVINFKNEPGKFEVSIKQFAGSAGESVAYLHKDSGASAEAPLGPFLASLSNKLKMFFDTYYKKAKNGKIPVDDIVLKQSEHFKEKDNYRKLLKELENKLNESGLKRASVFVEFDNHPPFKFESLRKFYIERIKEKLGFSEEGEKRICVVCGRHVPVSRDSERVSLEYKLYTLDKMGYILGYSKSFAPRNLPICLDCSLSIERGWNFIENNLSGRIGGVNFMLVPETFDDSHMNIILEKLKLTDKTAHEESQKEDRLKSLIENVLLDSAFNLTLLLYEKSQAQFRLYEAIEDLPPTRLKRFYEAFEAGVEFLKVPAFRENGFGNFFNFFQIKKEGEKSYAINEFVSFLGKLFRTPQVFGLNEIARISLPNIRYSFRNKNEDSFSYLTKAAFILLFLIENLRQDLKTGGESMDTQRFEDLPIFKNNPQGLYASLLGVLARMVMEAQKRYHNKDSWLDTPLWSKLKGLRLKPEDLPSIQTVILDRWRSLPPEIREYDFTFEKFFEKASFSRANVENITLSSDELSFYFTLGLGLFWEIVKSSGKNQETTE